MQERVNIQYSVELNDLSSEVARLLTKSLVEIQEIIKDCNELDQEETLNLKNSETIDAIRKRLAKADVMFADTNNIIKGYLSYKTTPETALDDVDNFDVLREKIESFKDSIEPDEIPT